jgi:hypothetical protein
VVDIRDGFTFEVLLSTPGADMEAHAINLDGYGSTAYVNYAFNSMARIGGRYFGAKLDGLFLLEGKTDAGAPIRGAICPGKLDFGTPQNKTVVEAWMGSRSDGALLMKLVADKEEYLYEFGSYTEDEFAEHRVKFGKGVKANYFTPVIYNEDGEDFEIDALQFEIATLSRKN